MITPMNHYEIIEQAYQKSLMHLFDVYWTSYTIESNHAAADKAFERGVKSLCDARDQACAILDGIDTRPTIPKIDKPRKSTMIPPHG